MEEEEENGEVCDTELCLSPISQRQSLSSSSPPSSLALASQRGEKAPELKKQKGDGNITIFYNGTICICDVTEIQARAIINMVKKEMEVEINNNNNNDNKSNTLECLQVPSGSNTTGSSMAMVTVVPSLLLNQSPSMKRSLQQFLNKRKTRSDRH
ncbi:protein TIFY 5A-like [Curcuma longa]|uniref:protein TIFY 5A-like n=1 Tax=Curcuma longa TaxID=136217 RepID=UPI003D9E029F